MKDKKDDCDFYRNYINVEGELKRVCVKDYCLCDDVFVYDENRNKRYQEAKNNDQAGSGIFFNK